MTEWHLSKHAASEAPYHCVCPTFYDDISTPTQQPGSQCQLQDPCAENTALNCAGCTIDPDYKELVCECKPGYHRPGYSMDPNVACSEVINPCTEVSNGGCDVNADCSYVAPGQRACTCAEAFTGNGESCTPLDVCATQPCGENEYCAPTGVFTRVVSEIGL